MIDKKCLLVDVRRSKYGYFTLYLDGVFEGNYDSYTEAVTEANRLLNSGNPL